MLANVFIQSNIYVNKSHVNSKKNKKNNGDRSSFYRVSNKTSSPCHAIASPAGALGVVLGDVRLHLALPEPLAVAFPDFARAAAPSAPYPPS